jgi:ADP-ribose pyrophosphatase YjhB (NUDIX family)
VERGQSLPETLAREVAEECGLQIAVGAPCLINEFHDPAGDFHQVEVFFRCTITAGALSAQWQDPEGVVHRRRFFTRSEVGALRLKPSSLETLAWEGAGALLYDPLEPILR